MVAGWRSPYWPNDEACRGHFVTLSVVTCRENSGFDPEPSEQSFPRVPILGHRARFQVCYVLADDCVVVVLEPAVFAPHRRVETVGETALHQRFVPTQKLDPVGVFAVELVETGAKIVDVVEA